MTEEQIELLYWRLRNKFSILVYLEELGLAWAETAIEPAHNKAWSHNEYLECYGSGNNN